MRAGQQNIDNNDNNNNNGTVNGTVNNKTHERSACDRILQAKKEHTNTHTPTSS